MYLGLILDGTYNNYEVSFVCFLLVFVQGAVLTGKQKAILFRFSNFLECYIVKFLYIVINEFQ